MGPGDLLSLDPGCRGGIVVTAADLGLPRGGNVDAISDGHDLFPVVGPIAGGTLGRDLAAMFSVDRNSVGTGAVARQAKGNGAASDVFDIQLLPVPGPVRLGADAPCLTPDKSDIDALTADHRFPLFFSVDAVTAAAMGVAAADILFVGAPGSAPQVFMSQAALGLAEDDDIDALSVGPEGFLFSLTRNSATARAVPEVGGAGLFANGPEPWASAADMGLKDDDELNALVTFVPNHQGPELSHTPFLPDQGTVFRIRCIRPGEVGFLLASVRPPSRFCIFGLCLGIYPDLILGVMNPADARGISTFQFHIPPGTQRIPLNAQALILNDPVIANWPVSNVVVANILFDWGWVELTPNGKPNGWQLLDPIDGYFKFKVEYAEHDGERLNGWYWVTAYGTLNGSGTITLSHRLIHFVDGKGTLGTPIKTSGNAITVTKIGISIPWYE